MFSCGPSVTGKVLSINLRPSRRSALNERRLGNAPGVRTFIFPYLPLDIALGNCPASPGAGLNNGWTIFRARKSERILPGPDPLDVCKHDQSQHRKMI